MSSNKPLRIAIIGAGPCGLAQLLAFSKAIQDCLVEVICFERQSDWGGLWRYTPLVGNDVHGEPIHSSMYRQLWSNNPKELLEFPDYTFREHYNCLLPSYVPRAIIYDYLTARATKGNIKQWIRFNTVVRSVDFDRIKNQFDIIVEDLKTDVEQKSNFDRVIVAIGHYHVPNMIEIEGIENFQGRILHSHEFRGADEFIDMNLLIIGGGFSADDIALQCHKFGARSIVISSRRGAVGYKWPATIRQYPMIKQIEKQKIHFNDGSVIDNIDAIIICTGYRHSYPFMEKSLRLKCGITDLVPTNLYKSIFWIDQPFLAYLGTPRQAYSFPMFDAQAALVCDVFLGRIRLPSAMEQRQDVDYWLACERAMSPITFDSISDFQKDYIEDIHNLLRTVDPHRSLFNYDLVKSSKVSKKYFQDKVNGILNYRCQCYPSVIGEQQQNLVQVTQSWIENKDDSMDRFLEYYRKRFPS